MLVHALALGVVVATAPLQSPPNGRSGGASVATATAVPTRDAPPIDGRKDDAAWREAPRFSDFRQFEPRVDADPSFRTEFQVAYDARNLYVFVRMFDSHP